MVTKTKSKTFDCVEMKRRGAEHVRQLTAGMTFEQEVEFWRQRSEELRQRREAAKKSAEQASTESG